MSFLKFLGADIAAAPVAKQATERNKKERNPVKAEIRVFKTGAVYPSAAAVQKYNLEFQPKGSETPGNGFDVIDGRNWANLKSGTPALFISPASRKLGKVDLFAQCTFEEDGTASSSVMDQGAKTFGAELLKMVKEVYNVEPTEEKDYVDMTIVEDADLQAFLDNTLNGVFHFPKVVSRGEKKGTATYVRRENALVYGFIPTSLLENVPAEEATVSTEVGELAPTDAEGAE